MSPAANDAKLDFVRLSAEEPSSLYFEDFLRDGKALMSSDLASVFERLGSTAEAWQARMLKLSGGRLLGRFFAVNRERLRAASAHFGVHHLANLGGCTAS